MKQWGYFLMLSMTWGVAHLSCEKYVIVSQVDVKTYQVEVKFAGAVSDETCEEYPMPDVSSYEGATTVYVLDRQGRMIGGWGLEPK